MVAQNSFVSKALALFPFGVPPSGGNESDRLKAELQTWLRANPGLNDATPLGCNAETPLANFQIR